jgi:hypothetical protein
MEQLKTGFLAVRLISPFFASYIVIITQKSNCLTRRVKTSIVRNGRELLPQGHGVTSHKTESAATHL